MPEPRELTAARRSLAEAEAKYRAADGLARLEDGLALLDDVIAAGSPAEVKTARNLASSYAARIYARINELVLGDAQLPEPELEHYFKMVLAFDRVDIELPKAAIPVANYVPVVRAAAA